MSWLSVTLRKSALGAEVADAFKGLEDTVGGAITHSPPVQALEHQTIEGVGLKAQQVVVDTIAAKFPGAETVAAEVTTPLFAGLEHFIEAFLDHLGTTQTVEGDPPPAA